MHKLLDFDTPWRGEGSSIVGGHRCLKKPNEDFFISDAEHGIYIVADGITRTAKNDIYPSPSPAREVAELFSHKVRQRLVESKYNFSLSGLEAAVVAGNQAVSRYNQTHFPLPDYDGLDLAGCAAAVVWLRGEQALIASVADCFVLAAKSSGVVRLAWEKVSQSSQRYDQLGYLAARKSLRNNPEDSEAWGAITGETAALGFVEYSEHSLSSFNVIWICTDGALALAESCPSAFACENMSELLEKVLEYEKICGKLDDKTAICLRRTQQACA